MQEKYRRNRKKVEREARDDLAGRMREGVELSDDQEEVITQLVDFFGREDGWENLQSPHTGVEMWVKYQQQRRGKSSIAIGKAEGTIDCTAEQDCTWLFEFGSNESRRISLELGDPARLELRKGEKGRPNEKVFATTKVRSDEKRSDELPTLAMRIKATRNRPSARAVPPP